MSEGSRSRSIALQPSAHEYPSALWSNVWHRPCREVMDPRVSPMLAWNSRKFVPRDKAQQDSWRHKVFALRCMVTSDAEHPVSIAMHGP